MLFLLSIDCRSRILSSRRQLLMLPIHKTVWVFELQNRETPAPYGHLLARQLDQLQIQIQNLNLYLLVDRTAPLLACQPDQFEIKIQNSDRTSTLSFFSLRNATRFFFPSHTDALARSVMIRVSVCFYSLSNATRWGCWLRCSSLIKGVDATCSSIHETPSVPWVLISLSQLIQSISFSSVSNTDWVLKLLSRRVPLLLTILCITSTVTIDLVITIDRLNFLE